MNVFIVYDLNAWPKSPTNNLKFKYNLFGAISIIKNSDREKLIVQVGGVLIITLVEML